MGKSMISNQPITVKWDILTTLWTGDTFTIYETWLDLVKASIVLKNKLQLERFSVDVAIDGTCTIVLRWLNNSDSKTEDALLKKEWNNWAKGYVTVLASDLLDVDDESWKKVLKWDFQFDNNVEVKEELKSSDSFLATGKSNPQPNFVNTTARDLVYTTPVNGDKCTVNWVDYSYNGITAQWEAKWVSTPVPNATNSIPWVVKIANADEIATWTSTDPEFVLGAKSVRTKSQSEEYVVVATDESTKINLSFIWDIGWSGVDWDLVVNWNIVLAADYVHNYNNINICAWGILSFSWLGAAIIRVKCNFINRWTVELRWIQTINALNYDSWLSQLICSIWNTSTFSPGVWWNWNVCSSSGWAWGNWGNWGGIWWTWIGWSGWGPNAAWCPWQNNPTGGGGGWGGWGAASVASWCNWSNASWNNWWNGGNWPATCWWGNGWGWWGWYDTWNGWNGWSNTCFATWGNGWNSWANGWCGGAGWNSWRGGVWWNGWHWYVNWWNGWSTGSCWQIWGNGGNWVIWNWGAWGDSNWWNPWNGWHWRNGWNGWYDNYDLNYCPSIWWDSKMSIYWLMLTVWQCFDNCWGIICARGWNGWVWYVCWKPSNWWNVRIFYWVCNISTWTIDNCWWTGTPVWCSWLLYIAKTII